ncbi:hypothetical protein [Paucilactobacillus sp. N302-9]
MGLFITLLLLLLSLYLTYRAFGPSFGKKHKPHFTGAKMWFAMIGGTFLSFIFFILVLGSLGDTFDKSSTSDHTSSTKRNIRNTDKGKMYATQVTNVSENKDHYWVIEGTTKAPNKSKVMVTATKKSNFNYGSQEGESTAEASFAKVKNGKFRVTADPVNINNASTGKVGQKTPVAVFATTAVKGDWTDSNLPKKWKNEHFKPIDLTMSQAQADYMNDDDSDSSDNKTKDSSSTTETSPGKYSTTKSVKNHLKTEGMDNVKSVSLQENVLTISTTGLSFNGNFIGAGSITTLVHILQYAKSSDLAKNGIALAQKGSYIDSKGNKFKEMDFVIYYSKDDLDSINFSNYNNIVSSDKNVFLDNATGYYINGNFVKGKKYQFKDSEASKDNELTSTIYQDLDE